MPSSGKAQECQPDPIARENIVTVVIEERADYDQAGNYAPHERHETRRSNHRAAIRHPLGSDFSGARCRQHSPTERDARDALIKLQVYLVRPAGSIAAMILEGATDAHECIFGRQL